MEGLSPADVAAMQKDDGFFGGDGMIILILFILMLGGGFGGFGNRENAVNNALTRAEMTDGFNMSELKSGVTGLGTQICAGLGEINRNIDQTRFEAAQNTCKITTTVAEQAALTRQLITENTIQDLRDKLQEKDNLLQSAQLTLANAAQTQNLLSAQGRWVGYQGCGSPCNCTGVSTTNW